MIRLEQRIPLSKIKCIYESLSESFITWRGLFFQRSLCGVGVVLHDIIEVSNLTEVDIRKWRIHI